MDKFTAIWLSHSSISAFKNCPRSYYLSTIYRDPRNNHKISLMTPQMALGSAVHEVLESLSVLPTAERFSVSLIERFGPAWAKVSGIKGGFESQESEQIFRERGAEMLRRVMAHPGPLKEKAVKIKMNLPYYWISQEDNLILCGKLDWLEYVEAKDGVGIIDFKTGVGEEKIDSLQLPIYHLLAHNCQTRSVLSASYWYIARDDAPTPKTLPDLAQSKALVLKIGKAIKLARALKRFQCPAGEAGCKYCLPFEQIVRGEAEFVGTSDFNTDIYVLRENKGLDLPRSEIL